MFDSKKKLKHKTKSYIYYRFDIVVLKHKTLESVFDKKMCLIEIRNLRLLIKLIHYYL